MQRDNEETANDYVEAEDQQLNENVNGEEIDSKINNELEEGKQNEKEIVDDNVKRVFKKE